MKPVLPNSSKELVSYDEGEISTRFLLVSAITSCVILIVILFFPPNSQFKDWFSVTFSKFGFNKIDSSVSPEAQRIIREMRLLSIAPEGVQELEQKFVSQLKENGEEYGDYYNVYSALWAHYNVTKDEKALSLMEKIEGVILQKWPDLYKASEVGGGFLR